MRDCDYQLFAAMTGAFGLSAKLCKSRVYPFIPSSPSEIELSAKSCTRVGWAPRAHQTSVKPLILQCGNMVGRGCPPYVNFRNGSNT